MPRWSLTPEERFYSKIKFNEETTCWEWTAYRDNDGYGMFYCDYKMIKPYKFSYELIINIIPKGFELDHLCRNRACVNPEHLEPVTHKENILRGKSPSAINAKRTHCKNGHLLNNRRCSICIKNTLHKNYLDRKQKLIIL